MHISEGVLDIKWCVGGYVAAAPLVGYALKKLHQEDIPKVSVVGAAFFAASLIHFRVGISSVHLTLIGLTGLMLGIHSVLAILAGLFFQAVIFQHGGLTTLGINTVTMGAAALIVHGFFILLPKKWRERNLLLSLTGGILSGVGVIVAAGLVALVIYLSSREYAGMAVVFTVANAILAGVEGIAGFFVVSQILRVKPELITRP